MDLALTGQGTIYWAIAEVQGTAPIVTTNVLELGDLIGGKLVDIDLGRLGLVSLEDEIDAVRGVRLQVLTLYEQFSAYVDKTGEYIPTGMAMPDCYNNLTVLEALKQDYDYNIARIVAVTDLLALLVSDGLELGRIF